MRLCESRANASIRPRAAPTARLATASSRVTPEARSNSGRKLMTSVKSNVTVRFLKHLKCLAALPFQPVGCDRDRINQREIHQRHKCQDLDWPKIPSRENLGAIHQLGHSDNRGE